MHNFYFHSSCALWPSTMVRGHSDWYLNVDFRGNYHHTKFQRNLFSTNDRIHTNNEVFGEIIQATNEFSLQRSIKIFILNCFSTSNFILILIIKNGTSKPTQQVLLSADFVTLSQGQSHYIYVGIYESTTLITKHVRIERKLLLSLLYSYEQC